MKVRIEKLVHGGSGMATAEGRKVFVPFSAPGDLLEVRAVAEHPGYIEAKIERILEPASCRVKPRCPVFGICGGCQWQHISYDEQLRAKREIVSEQLRRTGKIDGAPVLDTLPSPKQWNYRNRMQLHVDSAGRVGYYRPGSKDVVEFAECPIAEEELNRELSERRAEFATRDRGIALRLGCSTGFGQVNDGQNAKLKALLISWLNEVPHESILELHAGSGNFTFELARIAGDIVATEIDGRAIEAAQKRQEEQKLCNVQFRRMSAERAAERFAAGRDAVLLDPPRKGCPGAMERLARAGPGAIFYISCDPATLSRDLHILCEAGYRLVRVRPVDMFPQTFHTEALAMLILEGKDKHME